MLEWGKDLPSCVGKTIFSKLAISNLPSCRHVCKTWNDVILDYASISQFQFLTNAFLISTADEAFNCDTTCNPKIHCFNLDSGKHLDSDLDLELELVKSGYLQFDGDWSLTILSNQCNGLVFISKIALYDVYDGIFNPMTNEFIQVPRCEFDLDDIYFIGFGFSPTSKQYKLFRVAGSVAYRRNYGTIVPNTQESGTIMHVFTFGRSRTNCNPSHNQWRHLHDLPFDILRSGAYLNGVVYWLGKEKDNDENYVIYALDVETEQIELSAVLQVGPCTVEGGMGQSNGTICITFYTNWATNGKTIQVWIMREKGSWIRDFVIDDIPNDWESFELIKDFKDGEMLCMINMEFFCFYNRITKKKMMISKNQKKYRHNCQIESLNFGSLSKALAGIGS